MAKQINDTMLSTITLATLILIVVAAFWYTPTIEDPLDVTVQISPNVLMTVVDRTYKKHDFVRSVHIKGRETTWFGESGDTTLIISNTICTDNQGLYIIVVGEEVVSQYVNQRESQGMIYQWMCNHY